MKALKNLKRNFYISSLPIEKILMKKNKIKIICTLGPSSTNKKFLNFANRNNVSLLRLNMSHLSIDGLKKSIKFIKKHSTIPICIDTEGAQIRTKVKKNKFIKLNQIIEIGDSTKDFSLYPENIKGRLKLNDVLNIGFDNLKVKIIKIKKKMLCKAISAGKLENNKGVHLENRKIKIDYLTLKDLKSISVGKKNKIKNFALSFTNTISDITKFTKLLPKENKIFKIETLNACKNFKKIIKNADNFLIDRGDLSKDVKIENIPIVQRDLFNIKNKLNNKNIYVATNLLESMLKNNFPTRGEANDIFNSLEMGGNGLVLAAETAIGSHPIASVKFLNQMIKAFKKSKYKNQKYLR
jgi:pyruvate kinase